VREFGILVAYAGGDDSGGSRGDSGGSCDGDICGNNLSGGDVVDGGFYGVDLW
jgi:hypothetical protein